MRYMILLLHGSFQKSGVLIQSPNSRALIRRTQAKKNPQFMETDICGIWNHTVGNY